MQNTTCFFKFYHMLNMSCLRAKGYQASMSLQCSRVEESGDEAKKGLHNPTV